MVNATRDDLIEALANIVHYQQQTGVVAQSALAWWRDELSVMTQGRSICLILTGRASLELRWHAQ